MKIKSRFVKALIIFAGILTVLCGAFLIYVNITVSDFDRVQPERIVEEQINGLQSGALVSQIDFAALCNNRYENNDPEAFRQAYSSKVIGKELTYNIVASESSELSKTYLVKSGDENVGKIKLDGKDPKTRLLFFTSAEWSLSGFSPVVTDSVYNLHIYCPEGITAKINGIEPTEEELDDMYETPVYAVSGLFNAPEITYTDKEGKNIGYTVENNIVKPVFFDYRITLPKGVSVLVNGKELSGTPSGKDEVYHIREMDKPAVVIKDAMGKEHKYIDGEEIPLFDYTVSVPEDCVLSVEGMTLPEPEIADNPDAVNLLKYAGVELPKEKRYTFSLFSESISAKVTDGTNPKSFDVSSGSSRISVETFEEIPERIAKEVDILFVTELWSKFMTNDIGGEDNGFYTMAEYLIPDSEYYTYAKQWAYGPDIKFTSLHTLDGFSKESVTNFTSYGGDCFSCNVYFEKHMTLIYEDRFIGYRTDVFNSIVYFVKIDDGSWRIALMQENLEEE
ncbi:MAG: hypothetical protein J1F04_02220 [Oscillospiraceae bacterium]|nr:hypothetical protein [Oscillospiraceae bacterium]